MLQRGAQYVVGSWALWITVTSVLNFKQPVWETYHLESSASLLESSLACYATQWYKGPRKCQQKSEDQDAWHGLATIKGTLLFLRSPYNHMLLEHLHSSVVSSKVQGGETLVKKAQEITHRDAFIQKFFLWYLKKM